MVIDSEFDRAYKAEMARLGREQAKRDFALKAATQTLRAVEKAYVHKAWCASENYDDTGYATVPACNCKPQNYDL